MQNIRIGVPECPFKYNPVVEHTWLVELFQDLYSQSSELKVLIKLRSFEASTFSNYEVGQHC